MIQANANFEFDLPGLIFGNKIFNFKVFKKRLTPFRILCLHAATQSVFLKSTNICNTEYFETKIYIQDYTHFKYIKNLMTFCKSITRKKNHKLFKKLPTRSFCATYTTGLSTEIQTFAFGVTPAVCKDMLSSSKNFSIPCCSSKNKKRK